MIDLFIPYKDGQYTYQDVITLEQQLPNVEYINLKNISYNDLPVVIREKNSSIQNDIDDIFVFDDNCNKRYYLAQSYITKNIYELPSLKEQKINQLRNDYQNIYQIAILVDGINFLLELYGKNFDLMMLVSGKGIRDKEKIYIEVMRINQDKTLTPCRAEVPYIFANSIFIPLNKISVFNRQAKIKYETDIQVINNVTDLEALKFKEQDYNSNINLIQKDVFVKNVVIDIEAIIENLQTKTDAELLNELYHQVHINDFRAWYIQLQNNKNQDGKYMIFNEF